GGVVEVVVCLFLVGLVVVVFCVGLFLLVLVGFGVLLRGCWCIGFGGVWCGLFGGVGFLAFIVALVWEGIRGVGGVRVVVGGYVDPLSAVPA
ncbi:hypothetical protein, partial [Pseudomonas syringae group genomosp. 7]|uniref:hypothetical protein n=1 Tax=Pseudomonas syringae group genomosp. 7 TaxID=251699 RepID=UPI00376F7C7B